ncbi:TraX protein [Bifidobacterium goeldii]|uniref:TraX protein n=1 Tax=Bifidobacterium goeldii TaxID=2306975 RepID=A0A430FLS3_9BIFI|nr:TraX family protein [Bifidobacterium goeldii]RSX53865.1 TraX protein [Bifidobacterium goeldii]
MTSFALKVMACVFMTIDHVGEFIPGMPIELRWIGRLAGPIFIFLVGWSCEFTHDRKRYLLRLYVASVAMSAIQGGLLISNNVFTNLFQTALIISLLSAPTVHRKTRNIALYIAYQVGLMVVLSVIDSIWSIPESFAYPLLAATGSIFNLEGGLFYVLLGVILWMTREHKIILSASYIGMVAAYALAYSSIGARFIQLVTGRLMGMSGGPSHLSFIFNGLLELFGIDPFSAGGGLLANYQWMMVFALPFMLLYDRRRGPGIKWFFYAYYPAHIVALYGIGALMGGTTLALG